MVLGRRIWKRPSDDRELSPIVKAIRSTEKRSTGEIRVHLSGRWIEPDPLRSARKLFQRYRMDRTTARNAVLVYVNTRRKRYALVWDEGVQMKLPPDFWDQLGKHLSEDLKSTHLENAVAMSVWAIGSRLEKEFPPDV